MLARPAAIAAMAFADCLATRASHDSTSARIIARSSLRCELRRYASAAAAALRRPALAMWARKRRRARSLSIR